MTGNTNRLIYQEYMGNSHSLTCDPFQPFFSDTSDYTLFGYNQPTISPIKLRKPVVNGICKSHKNLSPYRSTKQRKRKQNASRSKMANRRKHKHMKNK